MSNAKELEAGAADRLDSLFRRYATWLDGRLRTRLGPDEAADMVQETYLRIAPYDGDSIRHPKAFLLRVALNLVRDDRRRRARRARFLEQQPAAEAEAASQLDQILLKQIILTMPPLYRDIFVLNRFGGNGAKLDVVRRLDEIDHRVTILGEAAVGAVSRIEALFAASAPLSASEAVKVRLADRAIQGRAPFHRQKNSANDAVLIEQYREEIDALVLPDRAAFVTHNVKDFSEPSGDIRRPHPDLADLFGDESIYSTSLSEILGAFAPELLEEVRFETEWSLDYRRLPEIIEAMDELTDKVWYNRHWGLRNRVASGEITVVEDKDYPVGRYPQDLMARQTWEGALAAAAKVEARRPGDLGPWTDFEWGMINGKLSALRWMLGDDWDMLDT